MLDTGRRLASGSSSWPGADGAEHRDGVQAAAGSEGSSDRLRHVMQARVCAVGGIERVSSVVRVITTAPTRGERPQQIETGGQDRQLHRWLWACASEPR
jgi:hypothetical protein